MPPKILDYSKHPCKTCGECRPADDFYWKSDGRRYSVCKPCCKTRAKANYDTGEKSVWAASLRRVYGLTPERYHELLAWSQGGCAICGAREGATKKKRLHVDHDHATGKVRGLLCVNCNVGLGNFKDSLKLLKTAVCYLEYFSGK